MLFMSSLSQGAAYDAMLAHQGSFGRFVSPKTGQHDVSLWQAWGADNGAFSGFDKQAFYAALEKFLPYKSTCRFVVVPDVPFKWEPTLEKYMDWHRSIRRMGFPAALAVQDGATVENIPWHCVDAIFIGGSTRWKREFYTDLPMFPDALTDRDKIIREAKRRNMWVHIGRQANSVRQLWSAYRMGADSVDGTRETKAPLREFTGYIAHTMWAIHQQVA